MLFLFIIICVISLYANGNSEFGFYTNSNSGKSHIYNSKLDTGSGENRVLFESIDIDRKPENIVVSTINRIDDNQSHSVQPKKGVSNGVSVSSGGDDNGGNDEPLTPDVSAIQMTGNTKESINVSDSIGEGTTDEEEFSRIRLKELWTDYITKPSLRSDLMNTISQIDFDLVNSKSFNSTVLYYQILSQFLHPLSSTINITTNSSLPLSKPIVPWLDREFVLSFRGLAVLAQYPQMYKSVAMTGKPTTAIRLLCPQGALSIQKLVIRALAESIASNLVYLDKNSLLALRTKALSLGIPRALLSRSHLFSALIDRIEEDDTGRYVLVLGDKAPVLVPPNTPTATATLPWLLASPSAAESVLQELKIPNDRIFFVMTSPDALATEAVAPSVATAPSQQQQQPEPGSSPSFPQFPFSFPGQSGDGGGGGVGGSNQGQNPFQRLPGQPGAGPGVGFPPGVQARGFHVVLQNGTASMVPMSEHGPMMPPLQIDMELSDSDISHPQDIPQKLARLFAEKQRELAASFNEEELQDLLSDPEGNMDKISQLLSQKFLSQLPLANIFQNMPAGILPSDMRNGSTVEMNVHLMPMGMGIGMAPPQGLFSARPPQSPPQPGTPPTLPGGFFRGLNLRRGKNNGGKSKEKDKDLKPPAASTEAGDEGDEEEGKGEGSLDQNPAYQVWNLFEEVTVTRPTDQKLAALWGNLIVTEISKRIYRSNKKLLQGMLEAAAVRVEGGVGSALAAESLTDLLGKQVLSKEECARVVFMAVKLQLGRDGVARAPEPTEETASTTASAEEFGSSSNIANSLVLSVWALESALCTVLKPQHVQASTAYLSKSVRPRQLTKEEILAMVTDKHEKALAANIILPQDIGVTYSMIGGLDPVKQLLRQCVTYPLKYPGLYSEGIAAEAVKGVLLFGPPGTGKTMLAKAVATEGGATFLAVDASVIENKWLGESEKNAKAVFTLARRLAPCVIYLDEVDSVLSSRERGDDSSHGTLTSVKTTLMQEWDGLRTSQDRVMVIASTNRPFDLDEAVLRRLPRRILVDLPDAPTRKEILAVSLANNRLAPEVNLTSLAEQLEGYSGSDIKEICREAVVRIAHERAEQLEVGSQSELDRTPLRPVNATDFKEAMRRLKASVDESGRELQKVVEWNEKYGEMKRSDKGRRRAAAGAALSMYI